MKRGRPAPPPRLSPSFSSGITGSVRRATCRPPSGRRHGSVTASRRSRASTRSGTISPPIWSVAPEQTAKPRSRAIFARYRTASHALPPVSHQLVAPSLASSADGPDRQRCPHGGAEDERLGVPPSILRSFASQVTELSALQITIGPEERLPPGSYGGGGAARYLPACVEPGGWRNHGWRAIMNAPERRR